MEIEQHRRYHGTVKLRRGEDWKVKSECERVDGVESGFTAGWRMTKEDTSIYVGEWAMIPRNWWPWQNWPKEGPGWIASGDLENLRPIQT